VEAFLVVMASVALLAGLVGLVARHVPRTTRRQQAPRAPTASWSLGCGLRQSSSNRRKHARGKEINPKEMSKSHRERAAVSRYPSQVRPALGSNSVYGALHSLGTSTIKLCK